MLRALSERTGKSTELEIGPWGSQKRRSMLTSVTWQDVGLSQIPSFENQSRKRL
jgi:hypothetical protein